MDAEDRLNDRLTARLERIGTLARGERAAGPPRRELLAELRSLLREAEAPGPEPTLGDTRKGVVGRTRTARARDIIGM